MTPGLLGLVLLCAAVGSGIGTPLSGLIVARVGEARTVAVMSVVSCAGLAAVAVGHRAGVGPVAAGLFLFGFGGGAWDVAMNVQGAAVEQALGRSILPRFHAGWSVGTVAGAGAGAVMVALRVPVAAHLLAVAAAGAAVVPAAARGFLPRGFLPRGSGAAAGPARAPGPERADRAAARRGALAVWTEPRTLLIGLFVLCVTFAEGTGNDWLSLAVIDGYHTPAVVGVAGFAVFLAAMTAGRWFGPRHIDRHGRVPVLRAGAAAAAAGLLLVAFGGLLPVALAGAALMGLGTSLGFPVGLSAAADDPVHAAGRVSAAASIGYAAFLAGPPAVGFLSDQVGVQHGISLAAALLAAAFFLAGATRPIGSPGAGSRGEQQGAAAGGPS